LTHITSPPLILKWYHADITLLYTISLQSIFFVIPLTHISNL